VGEEGKLKIHVEKTKRENAILHHHPAFFTPFPICITALVA